MVDIYEDLENFDFGEEVEKLRGENRVLLDKISKLEEENKALTQKNTVIEKEVKELRTNISSLLKTSTAEIQRKDKTIAELREQEKNVTIRPTKPFSKHNAIDNKPTELQGRQPEKAHFGIFKQAGFPPQKGPTTRTTSERINEEKKQLENTSKNLLNSRQDSSSISFASELRNALPKKDTQIDLFGVSRRYENSLSFHNYAKADSVGANETSQNDYLQNSIKAELDQTSSQLYDKVLERRLRQTQMEFEKDYSEIENSLHSKPFENKTSHKSPTRKYPSPSNKRDDYKGSISRHRSRSRSNERMKRNITRRSRSPLRHSDHKSFHQGRSNSREKKNNFHDNSSFQGRSGKHGRYNEKGRRETEKHFSRNLDRLRLDRKEHYNDSSRKLSEERRRESNASGDSIRSSKHGHESGRKPSPVPSSKCTSKASLDDRLEIRKEKYAKSEPNTHFIDETHVPRKKIKLGNNSPRHEVHKKRDFSSTEKQENLSQSTNCDIEEGEIQEQQTVNDAKKTACVPVHNTTKNDIPNTKVRLREAKEMPDRTHSVKVVDSSITHHSLNQTEPVDEPNTSFNDEIHSSRKKIKLGNNSPRHEVQKKSDCSSTDKQGNLSQPTNYNIEERKIQGQQTDIDANKTACVPVHDTVKNDNPNIKLREAKEMSDSTHSVKVVDSSIMHHGLKQTEPHGDSKTPSMTSTDDWTDSNSYSVKITKRPRRNIKYYFTDDDSKETAKTTPQVRAPVLITKESSENIHATNKPSVSSRHDTKDVKKHLVQPEMKGDTSMPKKHLGQDGNKIQSSLSKHHHEKSDSSSEAVLQINLEKSPTKSETSSKNSPENYDLKCHTSVSKHHSEKHSANPEKSELKCDTLITKNKLAGSDLFGDCSESDLKCSISENNPEKIELMDTWDTKSDPAKSDFTHDTFNQLRKSDLKCYTRKSKKPLENSFTSKHTHPDNSESKCDTTKHHHEKSGTSEPKFHTEHLDTKYDTSKPKHHGKSDITKPKTYVEISDLKCDINKSIHHVEKSDSSKPKIHEQNLDLNCEIGKNKSHVEKSDSSKYKTHLNNSKSDSSKTKTHINNSESNSDSSKTKIHLEKYDIGEIDTEKSDTDKPKIHLEKSDFSKPKTQIEKFETSKHKSHLEKSDNSKTKTLIDNLELTSDISKSKTLIDNSDSKLDSSKTHTDSSESKSDSSKTKTHIDSSESKSDSSKSKTHLDNLDSKHDSIKIKTHLEKYDSSKATNNIEKSDTNKPKTHFEKSDLKCDNSKTKIILEKSDSRKPKIHLENSNSESDSSKPKTHVENSESKCDTSKHKNRLEKSNTSKPKTRQDNSEAKCDSIKSIKQLEKTNSKWKYDLFGETSEHDINSRTTDLFGEISNPKTKSDFKSITSVSKTSVGKSDSKCEFSQVKSNTDKTNTTLSKSVLESDPCKTTTNLDKCDTTVPKSVSKSDTYNIAIDLHKSDTTEPKSVPKHDTSNTTIDLDKRGTKSETSNAAIDLDKRGTIMQKSVPKSETSNTAIDLEKRGTTMPKSVPKSETSNTAINLDKRGTTMPKSVPKSETSNTTIDLHKSDTNEPKSVPEHNTNNPTIDLDKRGTTIPKSVPKSETSNTAINLHKSDITQPKPVPKWITSSTTTDLSKKDTTVPKLVPKGDTNNITKDLDKSDITMPKSVFKSGTSKITTDLEKSNEKHNLSESKQIVEKPVVKCETNNPACIRKTCVTPISENTLHVKIFRRNTIIKKL